MQTAGIEPTTARDHAAGRPTVRSAVQRIEDLLSSNAACLNTEGFFSDLECELRTLHPRMRTLHPPGGRTAPEDPSWRIAELSEDLQRLTDEHTGMVGCLDRLIRGVASIASQAGEDQTVFLLKVRELLATIQRHIAEEERTLYLSEWHDTGGEGG